MAKNHKKLNSISRNFCKTSQFSSSDPELFDFKLNYLSHYFYKNFMKATVTKKNFVWREFLIFPNCKFCNVRKIFNEINFQYGYLTKMSISRNLCSKTMKAKNSLISLKQFFVKLSLYYHF